MNKLLSREAIEKSISALVCEFITDPFRFFTEADAVSRFHQLLSLISPEGVEPRTRDGFSVPLIHREYPTFFRFSDKDPNEKLGPPARRGFYDTVILNPRIIETNNANNVTNRNINALKFSGLKPIFAAVEFKLHNKGWSPNRADGVGAELGKLRLSHGEVENIYFVLLMRYTSPRLTLWEKYWDMVDYELRDHSDISCVVAVSWQTRAKKGHELFSYGNWIHPWGE